MKGTKAHFLMECPQWSFFRARQVSLSLTLYNTLEKGFDFLNFNGIKSLHFVLILRGEEKLSRNQGRDIYG